MHKIHPYRLIIAHFLLFWICGIIISGIVFMHKEVTSTGEIVTHIHPYDLGEKKHHQHHSDDEIKYLDIVFQGSYLNWESQTYTAPIQQVLTEIHFAEKTFAKIKQYISFNTGRDPPTHLA